MNHALNLEQISRALVLGFVADIPLTIVGEPGAGKSSIVYQVAEAPKVPYKMYDFNLSDKDRGDVGGIPFPVDGKQLEFLIASGLLPFDTDEKSILFLDEIDRAPIDVANMAQRIILERTANGHKLSPNCRIVCAMNGVTDIYTNPLSDALRNRMCFLPVETHSQGALNSYLTWAETHGVSPMAMAFAKFNPKIWGDESKAKPIPELALFSHRSFDYADRMLQVADQVNFKTADILFAVVAGLIGSVAALEFMEFRDIYTTCPTTSQVVQDPDHAPIPTDPGVRFAFTISLTNAAEGDRPTANAIAQYGLRWEAEDASYLYQRLLEKEPSVITTTAYATFNRRISA